jgi:integrase/recombinase XerD
MVTSFDTWMTELRGLSPNTRRHRRAAMYSLLELLHEQNKDVATLTIDELDIYVAKRYSALRRNSKAKAASNLRTVLRYLHEHGHRGRERKPANALLVYLRHGRPATSSRTVFLRAQAPTDRSPSARLCTVL